MRFPRRAVLLGALVTLAALAALGLGTREARGGATCGKVRFLAFYDSHGLTPFGDRLDAILNGVPGGELTSYTLGGASPGWFLRRPVSPRGYFFQSCEGKPLLPRSKLRQQDLRTPSLEDLLRVPEGTYEKQVVVLTLGSNVPGHPWVHTLPVERIVRTVNARSDAVCIWVGPPSIRNWSPEYSEKVYSALRDGIQAAAVGQTRKGPACHLVDSRPLSSYPPGGDGTHYGFTPRATAAAHQWADGVGREIDRIVRGSP